MWCVVQLTRVKGPVAKMNILKHFYPHLDGFQKPLVEATLLSKDVFMVLVTDYQDFYIRNRRNTLSNLHG